MSGVREGLFPFEEVEEEEDGLKFISQSTISQSTMSSTISFSFTTKDGVEYKVW